MTEPYNNGGVISGPETTWKVEVGERVMTGDGTVLELQEVQGGYRWVEIGRGYSVWMGACPCCGETGRHAEQCLEKPREGE